MSLERIAARLGLVALVVLTAFLLLQLARVADHAYAARETLAPSSAETPLPAAADWRLTIYFDRGAQPPATLVQGWSAPEPGSGVWSLGRHAVLKLPPMPSSGTVDLALSVEPFVAPARPFQRVIVRAGPRLLGQWRITNPGVATLHLAVPDDVRGPAGDLELQLDLPDADVPAERVKGSMDVRRLAIKLRAITVTG